MKCNCCGFVTRGNELKCPYCGEPYEKPYFLDKDVFFFNWFYVSMKSIIFVLSVNIFAIALILDVVISSVNNHSPIVYPFIFFVTFMSLYILTNFILKTRKNRHKLLNYLLIVTIFSVLFTFAYANNNNIFNAHLNSYQMMIGYFYPISIDIAVVVGIIRFLVKEQYDILKIFSFSILLFVFSAFYFGISFIPSLKLHSNTISNLIIYLSFAFTALISFNALLICKFRLSNKVTR